MAFNRSKSHEDKNQENYSKDAISHSELGLNSTLLLAYRDVPQLLREHLFDKSPNQKYRVLDFGCGAGLSTKIFSTMISEAGYQSEIVGIDISEENLQHAREILPDTTFIRANPNDSLQHLGEFDLIICNFVLVENKEMGMKDILSQIKSLLNDNGIAVITNCAKKAYKKTNKWYTFNNNFDENEPAEAKGNKLTFKEDQHIKVQVFADFNSDKSFTFFDFFHSGSAYRNAYQAAGLALLQTHKPIGRDSDHIEWQAEQHVSPYKIHIVRKEQQSLNLEKRLV